MHEGQHKWFKLPATFETSEKVTNGDAQSWWEPFWIAAKMISTSQKNGIEKGSRYGVHLFERGEQRRDSFQVPVTKKVINTLGSFLNRNSDGVPIKRVATNQVESKRLPIWWEPF
jgi:hypothetical protein